MPSSGRRPRKVQRRTARLQAHQPTPRIARPPASSSPRSEGLVVRRTRSGALDGADQIVQARLVLEVIDVARVDDQQGRLVPSVEELAVGARKLRQVVRVELALEI